MPHDPDPFIQRLYKIETTATLFDCSVRTIYRLIDAGELETVGQGKLTRIPDDSITAYIKRHRNQRGVMKPSL